MWTDEFLHGWSDFKHENNKYRVEDRESIIIEIKKRDYYDTPKNLILKDGGFLNSDFELIRKTYEIFAIYSPHLPRKIVYYEGYYTAREEIKQIVRIHERMHAYHHANTKSAWKDFSNISPVYLEFLAQLFTFLCVKGTNLESYFRNLSSHQSTIYQTWILAQDFSSSNAYKIYKEIFKNGATSKFGLDLFAQKYLEKASEDLKENKGLPKIIKTSDDLLQLERTLVCSIENLKKIIFITGILLKEVKF